MVDPNLTFGDQGKVTGSPLVSVIIPAYNAERFVGRTLEAVLAQTYTALEVLVVDDGSQDATGDIVRRYQQQDPRIKLLHQQNAGVAAARNLAVATAQGEFIAPVDADDIWFPHHIEAQVNCFLASPASVGLV
ncbi:MAG: glycosyltransferase family A protein, partial [Nodosilinea sp.]